MVSISRSLPYEEIVESIDKEERLAIVSCNACANYCRTGGRRAMATMSSELEADGYNVVASEVVPKACILTNLGDLRLPDEADTVLMMACVSGTRAANRMFSGKKVVSTNVTLGIGYYDSSRKGSVLVSPYPGHQGDVGKAFPGQADGHMTQQGGKR